MTELISDDELAELERDAKRTALWDDQEKEALYAKLAAAYEQRGRPPPPPLP